LQEQANQMRIELPNHLQDMRVEYLSFSFTDGERRLEVPVKTSELMVHAGEAITKSLERAIIIYYLDQFWQEHLRNMDDLRQAVQNASYEQKDPLLVYKFESYELFSSMIAHANEAIISYLMKSNLLLYKTKDERIKITEKAKMLGIEEIKQDILSQLGEIHEGLSQERPKLNPIRSQKIANRNERVTVQYQDGTIKKDVKFKMVEEDVASGKCMLLESDER